MPWRDARDTILLSAEYDILISTRADLEKIERAVRAVLCGHTDLMDGANVAVVSASDLKMKGISTIEHFLQDEEEVVISVSDKPRHVVMDIARYDFLRECEIATTWAQAREDVAAGCYRHEGTDAHLGRIEDKLTGES